jgi:small subunit ribosomal protein S9
MTEITMFQGTGRRKSAIAQVVLKKGTGKIMVNKLSYDKYFTVLHDQVTVISPLATLKQMNRYDVVVRVNGGGKTGQAGAVVLGLARALKLADPTLDAELRKSGYLTRDPRMKERKKYGRRGARRSPQWTKR